MCQPMCRGKTNENHGFSELSKSTVRGINTYLVQRPNPGKLWRNSGRPAFTLKRDDQTGYMVVIGCPRHLLRCHF